MVSAILVEKNYCLPYDIKYQFITAECVRRNDVIPFRLTWTYASRGYYILHFFDEKTNIGHEAEWIKWKM